MNRPGVVIVLWITFAFVAWNVLYDREVATAATEFTREQIAVYQQGGTPASIPSGFSPHVRAAALHATLWVLPILLAGGLTVYLRFWRKS